MTDHGWPGHHDDPGHHDEPIPFEDDHHIPLDEHPAPFEEPDYLHHDEPPPAHDPYDTHDAPGQQPDTDAPATGHTAADVPDDGHQPAVPAEPELTGTDTVFPPAVDVGDLPEPVDGFPWIDTGSLGVVDPAGPHTTPLEPVHPQELAEYAATDLPPGADPWATLAESDDPATAALARWWSENQP